MCLHKLTFTNSLKHNAVGDYLPYSWPCAGQSSCKLTVMKSIGNKWGFLWMWESLQCIYGDVLTSVLNMNTSILEDLCVLRNVLT